MTARTFQVLLHPMQRRFLDSKATYRGFCGGRGSGKSFTGAYDLITRACRNRGRLYMVVAPSFPLLKSASIRTFIDLATRLGKLKAYHKTDFLATLDSDSQVMFRSAENPESLRGPNISGLWIDEAQGTDVEAFNVAIGCLREDPVQNWATCTFTPRGKQHWTYERFGRVQEDGTNVEPDTDFFKCSTRDNPFVPPSLAESMARQYTSQRRDQEIEGEFVEIGGTLFHREWWDGQIVDTAPRVAKRVRYWDKAAIKSGGCYTCGVLMAESHDGAYYIENVIRNQWSTFERDQAISITAQLDQEKYGYGAVRIFIEEEGGSGGKDSLRYSVRSLAGHIVSGDRPNGEKRVRAEPLASQVEARNVFLVRDPFFNWIPDFIDELTAFPTSKFADQVDAASGAFNQLARGVYSTPAVSGPSSGTPPPGGHLPSGPGTWGPAAVPGMGLAGMPSSGLANFRPR